MTTKLKSLGEPRLGIALIWLVPTRIDGKPNVMAPVTDEELEHFRQVTGVDAEELTSRLQRIGAEYQRDPEALRAEIMRITGGDEQMVDWMVELMRAAQPEDSGDNDSSRDGESGQQGQVIEFPGPARRDSDEEDDGESR
jgi:hypothetical protein